MRIIVVVALAVAAPARADQVAGTYDVKFEEVATTCNPKLETLTKGAVVLTVKKGALTVKFDKMAPMVGTEKDGKITAKTKIPIGTSVGGISARYSVAGKVDNAALELVLTAQYVRQDNYQPHCQHSWNVKGTRR